MAVPFNLPEDPNEVEIVVSQLQALLTRLKVAVKRTDSCRNGISQHALSVNTRARTATFLRSRSGDEDIPVSDESNAISSTSLPEFSTNLVWLASTSHEPAWADPLELVILQRSGIDSENFFNNTTKTPAAVSSSIQEQLQEWKQETDVSCIKTSQPRGVLTDTILTKFVPDSISAPLWTAMICVVGWHLFRAR